MEVLLHPIFVQSSSAPPAWTLSPLLTPAWRLGHASQLPFSSQSERSPSSVSPNMTSRELLLSGSQWKDHENIGYACLTSLVLLPACGLVSTRATWPCVDLSKVKPCADAF